VSTNGDIKRDGSMATAVDAADLGAAFRAARRRAGLTQAELADRAGVSRQWLVAVERGHDRAEIGKILSVAGAVHLELRVNAAGPSAPARRTWLTAADAARAVRTEVERGDEPFALRLIARALSDLRALDEPADVRAWLEEPPSTGDPRWDTLLAAATRWVCRRHSIRPPAWTRAEPLDQWWFPAFEPVLAARTFQRTPPELSVNGIWLDPRALEVA
jgi:transcriptional regulator with XRE-family HTH domain